MKKIRIGIWLRNEVNPEVGGAYSYQSQLLDRISEYNFKNAELVFLANKYYKENNNIKKVYKINWEEYRENRISKWINLFAKIICFDKRKEVVKNRKYKHEKKLKNELNKLVDIIYYTFSDCEFPNFPYIYTLWDLGHLSMFAFPEVSMNGVYEYRKSHHDLIPHKALMIFTESNTGKEEIIKYLNINSERIKVVPLFPSSIVNNNISSIKPKVIQEDISFIHYPAQYWAHKNHYNLLIAFKYIIEKYPTLRLVLTGSDKGNKEYIKKTIIEQELVKNVIDLGFVSKEELKWLYLNSLGIVMPTFLGPTNMPLLEAAELGCPVSCSKLPGHIELLGSYGYYFDPKNPLDIAKTVCEMIIDKNNNIVKNYQSRFNIENALNAIDEAFSELSNIRTCWGEYDEIF